MLQLDFQLANEEGGDTASFIPNGEWALLGIIRYRTTLLFILFSLSAFEQVSCLLSKVDVCSNLCLQLHVNHKMKTK